ERVGGQLPPGFESRSHRSQPSSEPAPRAGPEELVRLRDGSGRPRTDPYGEKRSKRGVCMFAFTARRGSRTAVVGGLAVLMLAAVDAEAGFEIWKGGQGLGSSSFSFTAS